jgi:hypothetical protein
MTKEQLKKLEHLIFDFEDSMIDELFPDDYDGDYYSGMKYECTFCGVIVDLFNDPNKNKYCRDDILEKINHEDNCLIKEFKEFYKEVENDLCS